ncbi:MAG: phosphodiester glycosidase family protein [Aristaeellaceae bacterium]
MKPTTRILLMLLTLMLSLPCAMAETAYAPIEKWLENNQPAPAPYTPNPDCYLPDNGGYVDDSLSILIENTYWTEDVVQVDAPAENVTTVMLIRVKLTDATQFRTALSGKYPSKQTARVEQMARQNNAVLAINGDFFNYHDSGIAYRNGRKLRFNANNLRELLIVDELGDFHYLRPTSKKAWDAYVADGGTVLHTYWFGPNLIREDGQPMTKFTDNENNGPLVKAQRMVIGQTGELEYLIVCCEGPESSDYSGQGYTLPQMALLCYRLGMDNAYNLDGGSSTTVVLNGTKINSPSNPKKREVGDCIYFATLIPNE